MTPIYLHFLEAERKEVATAKGQMKNAECHNQSLAAFATGLCSTIRWSSTQRHFCM